MKKFEGKKINFMNFAVLLLLLIMALSLTACQPAQKSDTNSDTQKQAQQNTDESKKNSNTNVSDKKFKIGIVQIVEHAALDEAKRGFIEGLKEAGLSENVEFIEKNAQGQFPNALAIANSFVDEKVDLIYAIATPSAQATKQAVNGSIPVIFSAVTDPIEAGLIDSFEKVGGNVTGVSDAAPMKEQLELFKQINPKIRHIGVIYSTSETNSEVQIRQLERLSGNADLEFNLLGVSAISEISAGMDLLLEGSDAIYMITDNLVSSSAELVANKTSEAGKFIVCAEENLLKAGSLITKSASYYDMGKQCSDMAKKVLIDQVAVTEIPAEMPKDLSLSYNEEVAKKMGFDIEKEPFKSAKKF